MDELHVPKFKHGSTEGSKWITINILTNSSNLLETPIRKSIHIIAKLNTQYKLSLKLYIGIYVYRYLGVYIYRYIGIYSDQ